jgi:hypothetical protein
MIALSEKHVAKAFQVCASELAISGRGALWLNQSFRFKESNFRNGDIREIPAKLR